VYTLNLLPESLRPLFYLNPMTAIIEGFHRVLLNLSVTTSDLMIISLTMTFLAVFFGWRVFKQESKNFDDWV